MTNAEVVSFSRGPVPTSDDNIGCFSDVVGDRVLATVTTDNAMTVEVSVYPKPASSNTNVNKSQVTSRLGAALYRW